MLAAAIAASRLLGFARDVLLARLFGATREAEAFVVAFRLPNLLRDLVAEGAVTSAFVPVLSWYRAKKPEEFWGLSHALLSQMLILLCLLGAAGVFAADPIVRVIAPGFAHDPEKLALTIRLTRLLFPFITLVGLWAYFMGLLNSLRHFAIPSLGQVILNVCMIAACLWVAPRVAHGTVAVAWAVLLGGVVQLAVQIPVARRLGFRWRWRWRHPGSRHILRQLGPRMLGSAVYQVNVLVDTALASLGTVVGDGAVAALYFANRLVQLPLALFGTAAAQASLPSLAEQAAHQDFEAFRKTVVDVIRMIAFMILPAAVGLLVLAVPIVRGLLQRGAFDAGAAAMTAHALAYYAPGLLAFALSKVFAGAFYALQDTWTPVKLAAEAVVLNIIFSLLLMGPMQVAGLALAASLSNTVNSYRLARRLESRLAQPLLQPLADGLLRMALAAALMGGGCWLLWRVGPWERHPVLGLAVVVPAGGVLYAAACRLLQIHELSPVLQWFRHVPWLQSSVGD